MAVTITKKNSVVVIKGTDNEVAQELSNQNVPIKKIISVYFNGTNTTLEYFAGEDNIMWTPSYLSSVTGWWDASDSSTIIESGGQVSQWNDKSANAVNVLSPFEVNQPETGVRTINGKNALFFDSAYDSFGLGGPYGGTSPQDRLWNGSNSLMMYFVGVADPGSNKGCIFSSFNVRIRWEALGDTFFSTSLLVDNGVGGFTNSSLGPTNAVAAGTPHMRGVIASFAGKAALSESINGTVTGYTPAFAATPLPTASYSQFRINDGAAYFTGAIGEMLIVENDNSLDTQQKIEGYLAWKWGLESNLPVSHPYKTAPPIL